MWKGVGLSFLVYPICDALRGGVKIVIASEYEGVPSVRGAESPSPLGSDFCPCVPGFVFPGRECSYTLHVGHILNEFKDIEAQQTQLGHLAPHALEGHRPKGRFKRRE